MWNCAKCDESLLNTFAYCWQCGTDRNGNEDPGFVSEPDDINVVMEVEETERPPRWLFSLSVLLLLVTCTALIVGQILGIPKFVTLGLGGVIVANVLGLILGLFVTYFLRFPNDGSLTWDDDGIESPLSVDDHAPNCEGMAQK